MRYNIFNQTTGKDLGTWPGSTATEALDAMARSRGFASFDEAERAGSKPLRGNIITTRVGLASEGRKEWKLVTLQSGQTVIEAPNDDCLGPVDGAAPETLEAVVRACNAHEVLMNFLRDIDLLDHPDAGDYNPLCQGGTTNATALDNIMAHARKLLSDINAAGAAA